MKKTYLKPTAYIEAFSANEYVAACYSLACIIIKEDGYMEQK